MVADPSDDAMTSPLTSLSRGVFSYCTSDNASAGGPTCADCTFFSGGATPMRREVKDGLDFWVSPDWTRGNPNYCIQFTFDSRVKTVWYPAQMQV